MQFFMRWGRCRLILCGFNGDELLNLELRQLRRYDLNTSISGRMLLSHAPLAEQKEIIDSWGENRGVFQGMTQDEILERLRILREAELCTDCHKGKFAAALPLQSSEKIYMGIGAVWREENDGNREKIIEALRKCASKLSDIINVTNFA
jgi:DNA-binding IclR family transcriptional regulator